jgi:hypothetical protein
MQTNVPDTKFPGASSSKHSYYSVTCRALRCLKRYLICYVIINVEHVTAFGSPDSMLVLTCVGVTLQGKRSSFKPTRTAPCTAWPLNTLQWTEAPSQPRDKHLLKALSARRTLSNTQLHLRRWRQSVSLFMPTKGFLPHIVMRNKDRNNDRRSQVEKHQQVVWLAIWMFTPTINSKYSQCNEQRTGVCSARTLMQTGEIT